MLLVRIVFEVKSRVERLCLVRNNTVVSPLTIALFGGPTYIPKSNVIAMDDSDSENDDLPTMKFMIDDWIYFVLDEELAVMIHQLRIKLNAMFIKTLCNLDKKFSFDSKECKVIEVISGVLEAEDDIAGFKCPQDVGVRPILLPMRTNRRNNNNNKIQRSNAVGYAQNGQSALQASQLPLQSHHPLQRQIANQSANKLNPTHHNQQITLVYRRNKNGNRNGVNFNSNANDIDPYFEQYVLNFQCQVRLKSTVRYFVLHGSSRKDILDSYNTSQSWRYSSNTLRLFKSIKNVSSKQFVSKNIIFIILIFSVNK